MSYVVRAIETTYKGYRFRSRLEARWAVFFDALGVEWEYEKEGYDLGNHGRYLPDFWMPQHEVFIEVKGVSPSSEELQKCRLLRDGTEYPVYLIHGLPLENSGTLFCWDLNGSAGSSEWNARLFDLQCKLSPGPNSKNVFWNHFPPLSLKFGFWVVEHVSPSKQLYMDPYFTKEITGGYWDDPWWNVLDSGLVPAANKAKAARFEHGENPRP